MFADVAYVGSYFEMSWHQISDGRPLKGTRRYVSGDKAIIIRVTEDGPCFHLVVLDRKLQGDVLFDGYVQDCQRVYVGGSEPPYWAIAISNDPIGPEDCGPHPPMPIPDKSLAPVVAAVKEAKITARKPERYNGGYRYFRAVGGDEVVWVSPEVIMRIHLDSPAARVVKTLVDGEWRYHFAIGCDFGEPKLVIWFTGGDPDEVVYETRLDNVRFVD